MDAFGKPKLHVEAKPCITNHILIRTDRKNYLFEQLFHQQMPLKQHHCIRVLYSESREEILHPLRFAILNFI